MDADAQGALRLQIRKLLEREPGLAGELETLQAEVPAADEAQSINQIGDRNRAAMVKGTGNTTTVS